MAETTDATGATPAPIAAVAGAPPPPAAPPNLYDPERNRQCGVTTLEEVWAEFSGNQDALAARIRQDKKRRHQKTWDDASERASDGVRRKVLKETLKGTKRSTEAMIHMTGCTPPTSQMSIAFGEYFPWAAPRLRGMAAQSQLQAEPGTGVAPYAMPSDGVIIQMGKEEAKKAGAWGVLQTLLINPARGTVDVVDLPKNIGWKNGRRTPYPWWKDAGPLDPPWDGFHLHTEVVEPDQHREPQLAWTLDLYVRDGVPVKMHGRAFVVRSANNILASAADALGPFTPHVTFIAASKVADLTGKQHATFDEIADALIMAPGALAERLRGDGYLNLRGEPTPAALDAGITTIVDGGTQFCFDAIKSLVGEPKAEASEADETADAVPADVVPGAPDAPKADTDPAEGTADIAAPDKSGEEDAPAPEIDPTDATVGVAAPDEPGEGETPTLEIDPTDEPVDVAAPDEPAQPADVPAEPESEAPEEAVNATGRVTVWRGGGMQQVTAQPKHQRTTDADKVNQPATGPAPETLSDVADTEAGGRQTVAKLESARAALLAAEIAMGRRTADGEFVPHAGDNQVLRDRIKTAAEAMAKTYAKLTSSVAVYQTLLKNLGTLTMKVQQLEAENAVLKRRVQQPSAEHAQIVPFRGAPSTEDGSRTASAY